MEQRSKIKIDPAGAAILALVIACAGLGLGVNVVTSEPHQAVVTCPAR
jgi:hypothetical protein